MLKSTKNVFCQLKTIEYSQSIIILNFSYNAKKNIFFELLF